jgi:hypothetical protein
LIPRLTLLAVLLLQQPIEPDEHLHLRMYVHHRNRFYHFHEKRLIPVTAEFAELEGKYFELLKVWNVSEPGDPKGPVRREMLKKAKQMLKELERIKKEWERATKRIEKMP